MWWRKQRSTKTSSWCQPQGIKPSKLDVIFGTWARVTSSIAEMIPEVVRVGKTGYSTVYNRL
jgi:hypothetical protein